MTISATASTLSLAAAGIYLIVALAGVLACSRAIRQRQTVWHAWAWIIVAVLFVVLALIRCFAIEEWVRTDLRDILFERAVYDQRQDIQKPLVAVFFVAAASLAAGSVYGVAKWVTGRRNIVSIAALACTGGMIFLLALRLISLHSVDALLYGRLKLNWIIDLGLSGAVIVFALWYRALVQGKSG